MKIHKILTDNIEEAITEIFDKKNHTAFVVQTTLAKDKRWGARDRRFMAETILNIVKHYRYLCFLTNQNEEKLVKKSAIVACALWLEHQEIPEFYNNEINVDIIAKKQLETSQLETKILHSFPDWLDELLSNDLGKENWAKNAEASNFKASTYLRVNTFKSTIEQFLTNLLSHEMEVEICENIPNCIELLQRADVRKTEAYQNGWIEIQDAGSQFISAFLNPQKGDKIIDACAGAGGKSLHIADLMANSGEILSMDVDQKKLRELENRFKRNSYTIIKTHLHQPKTTKNYYEWADKLLLDVPCSGLGVLKRNPGDKWSVNQEKLNELFDTQASILKTYSRMLKPQGILVYATCSIYSMENQEQIKKFLSKNPNYKLIEEKQLFPSDGFDGFYMAKLQKN